MNIFEILSRGKSRLHEPSMSAMLGFLLSPSDDHGLSDSFLNAFLELINSKAEREVFGKFIGGARPNVGVELEKDYGGKQIDVEVSIYEGGFDGGKEVHRILIENKIRENAVKPGQLLSYHNAVLADEDFQAEAPELTIVFLTPEPRTANKKLHEEYERLISEKRADVNAVMLHWTSEDECQPTIVGVAQTILEKELRAQIKPINEYMRQTLKAFVYHLSQKLRPAKATGNRHRDLGSIVDEGVFSLRSGESYRIVRRDSSQIQVFGHATGEKEVAKRLLLLYLEENEIECKSRNTRGLGKCVLEHLHGRSSQVTDL